MELIGWVGIAVSITVIIVYLIFLTEVGLFGPGSGPKRK